MTGRSRAPVYFIKAQPLEDAPQNDAAGSDLAIKKQHSPRLGAVLYSRPPHDRRLRGISRNQFQPVLGGVS
jgi:hypothetical protein